MGHCDPKQVRKGRAWYQTVNDPIPPHVLAMRQLPAERGVPVKPLAPEELKAWCDELDD